MDSLVSKNVRSLRKFLLEKEGAVTMMISGGKVISVPPKVFNFLYEKNTGLIVSIGEFGRPSTGRYNLGTLVVDYSNAPIIKTAECDDILPDAKAVIDASIKEYNKEIQMRPYGQIEEPSKPGLWKRVKSWFS
jgi:hypothetical protein